MVQRHCTKVRVKDGMCHRIAAVRIEELLPCLFMACCGVESATYGFPVEIEYPIALMYACNRLLGNQHQKL